MMIFLRVGELGEFEDIKCGNGGMYLFFIDDVMMFGWNIKYVRVVFYEGGSFGCVMSFYEDFIRVYIFDCCVFFSL